MDTTKKPKTTTSENSKSNRIDNKEGQEMKTTPHDVPTVTTSAMPSSWSRSPSPLTRREKLLLGITTFAMLLLVAQHWAATTATFLQPSSGVTLGKDFFQTTLRRIPSTTVISEIPNYNNNNDNNINAVPQIPRTFPKTKAYPCETKTLAQVKDNMYSQQGEDAELLAHFNGLCGGSYIEMGALDGLRFSNSWLFHLEFSWQGLLVELTKENYDRLVVNRPHELALVQAGVCKERTNVHLVQGHSAVSGIWEFASPEYREKWWPNVLDPKYLPTIDCLPLQDILDQHIERTEHGFHYFDFFSLDVEGGEWNALQSIDWDRTAFGVLFLEAPDSKGLERDSIITYVQRRGYGYLGEKNNSLWFLHGDFYEIYSHVT
eukprot:scaffold597_cov176-Amphora_coffeaeformis.AAC.30